MSLFEALSVAAVLYTLIAILVFFITLIAYPVSIGGAVMVAMRWPVSLVELIHH